MPQLLAQHLIDKGLLPARVVDEALRRMSREGGGLDTVLLEMGAVSEAGILQAISDVTGVRLVNLADFEPNAAAGPLMPFKMARQLNVVPLSVDGPVLHLACAYPLQQTQLKEASFLFGRRLELWMALECRVRDWQLSLYGHGDGRFQRLLFQLDPARPRPKGEAAPEQTTEALSQEVLERIARGIVEEPVLLDRPKKREAQPPHPPIEILSEPATLGSSEDPKTSVLDPTAYSRFARLEHDRLEKSSSAPLVDFGEPTRVMEIREYETFAKEVSNSASLPSHHPTSAAPRISFPGGVLPPRRSPEVARVRKAETVSFLQPASAPRPSSERVRSAAHSLAAPPSLHTFDDELDFSHLISRDEAPLHPSAPTALEPVLLPVPSPAPIPLLTLDEPPPPMMDEVERPLPPAASATQADYSQIQGVLPAPPGLATALATEWSLSQAREALREAVNDRERLMSVVLEYALRTFEFAASFAVMRGAAVGWDARGEGEVGAIRQLAVPLDAASVFRTVALTRGSYVGPLPPDALSQHYLALLGRAPRTILVWPVEVQSRLVAILYGDCGAGPISQRRLADFILFCQELPSAFHDLILFRKQNPRAPNLAPPPSTTKEADLAQKKLSHQQAGGAEWLKGLSALLTGPDPAERLVALRELAKSPEEAARGLARAFPGPSGWSRLPVGELPDPDELGPIPGALARLGHPGALALAPLLDARVSDTRYLALLTAGSLPYPEVVDGVMRALFDYDPDISSAARAAAAGLRHVPAFRSRLPELRKELASPDALRRSLAARALGMVRDSSSVEVLINLTGSSDDLCAQSAAEALKEITRADLGTNPSGWTAWWATRRERRRIEWLVEALGSEDSELRLGAIEELARATGDNLGFLADAPKGERTEAVARWRELVAQRADLQV